MYSSYVDRDSSVGTTTCYGLNGPGIESRWGARFSAPVQTVPGNHPAFYAMGTGFFPGVNRPGRDIDHPSPSSAEGKERVELYLYSPSGPSWSVIVWPLSLPLPIFMLCLCSTETGGCVQYLTDPSVVLREVTVILSIMLCTLTHSVAQCSLLTLQLVV